MPAELGFKVTAIDPSVSGIKVARVNFPAGTFENASAYEDLIYRFGTFPVVVSLEVVEYCVIQLVNSPEQFLIY